MRPTGAAPTPIWSNRTTPSNCLSWSKAWRSFGSSLTNRLSSSPTSHSLSPNQHLGRVVIPTLSKMAEIRQSGRQRVEIAAHSPVRLQWLSRATKKAETLVSAGFKKSGGNLLSRKLYNHYHRQDCV